MEPSSRILTLPNVLSLLRLACIPLILVFMLERDLTWALILLLTAGISDSLDGVLARLLRQRTLFGMYLDPAADKLLLSSSFLVLAITGEVPWIVTGFVLGRDLLLIVGVVVLVLRTDIRQYPPSMLGKANTVLQLGFIFVLLLDEVYGYAWLHQVRAVLVVAIPIVVVASGAQYVHRGMRLLRERKRPAPVHQ